MSKKYPEAVYAAAGAGDYAYQQLRKLPGVVAELREKVASRDIDIDRVRTAARRAAQRGTKVAREGAMTALDEARTAYADLVARGERVFNGAGSGKRTPIEGGAPAGSPVVDPVMNDGMADMQAKPVKRTRPVTAGK